MFDNVQWRGNDSFICNCSVHNDKKASLVISKGDNGGIIFHCFADCPTEKILASKGLTFADISPEREQSNVTKEKFDFQNVIAAYEYRNNTCKLRDRNKNFLWQHKEPDGTWKPGRGKAPHVLYQAGTDQQTTFICEGEKDADNVSQLGLYAVSSENGAGTGGKKWYAEYTEELTGKSCVLLPDNDDVGREFMQYVAAQIAKKAHSVKVLNLLDIWQELPEKGDISDIIAHFGAEKTKELLSDMVERASEWTPFDIQTAPQLARNAAEYTGNLEIQYLYEPYFPYDQYTDVFGKSGTGKTFFVALVCAATTTGRFPTETKEPGTVLYISGEESFEEIADRISRAGGDLSRVNIIDRCNSVGLNFDTSFDTFAEIVKKYTPNLLVCDPWQCFCGERIDLNRQNQTRPLLQKVSLLAKETHCAIVFIAHMNKSQFLADANDGLSGSGEIINAARSAIRIIEDETDQDCRIAVHTKATHAKRGQSLKYRFLGNRIVWDGFSEITKETLEQASRNRKTPLEALQNSYDQDSSTRKLITALMEESQGTEICGKRLTYDDFKLKYGDSIFNGQQPKRAIDSVISSLAEREITVKTGIQVRRNNKNFNGFYIQRVPNISTE